MPWDVGGVRITRVVEQVMPFPVDFFPEATPAAVAAERWLTPTYVDAASHYLMSIHSYVIESESRRIVVDTCVGNFKSRPAIPAFDHLELPFLTALQTAGFAAESIDQVLCTHLHVDHVGWNTYWDNGEWVPTFPRARYLMSSADVDHWSQSRDPLHANAFADSVQPVIDAGLVDTVSGDTDVTRSVHLRRTPGHTPGHMSVWIGEQCVITGDGYRFTPQPDD